jgi:hypothetical protein
LQIPKSLKRNGKCHDPPVIATASGGTETVVSYFSLSRNFGVEHPQEEEQEQEEEEEEEQQQQEEEEEEEKPQPLVGINKNMFLTQVSEFAFRTSNHFPFLCLPFIYVTTVQLLTLGRTKRCTNREIKCCLSSFSQVYKRQ